MIDVFLSAAPLAGFGLHDADFRRARRALGQKRKGIDRKRGKIDGLIAPEVFRRDVTEQFGGKNIEIVLRSAIDMAHVWALSWMADPESRQAALPVSYEIEPMRVGAVMRSALMTTYWLVWAVATPERIVTREVLPRKPITVETTGQVESAFRVPVVSRLRDCQATAQMQRAKAPAAVRNILNYL